MRELRQARYDAQGTGFQLAAMNPISGSANASNSVCFMRVGGASGGTYTSLAIRQSGSQATLDNVSYPACTAVAPHALATNVSSLRFDYWSYGSGGTPAALALNDASFGSKLSFIDVTLSVTPNNGPAISYRSRVVLRNGAWGAVK